MNINNIPAHIPFLKSTSNSNNNKTTISKFTTIFIAILTILIFVPKIFSKNEFYTFPDIAIINPSINEPYVNIRLFVPFSISHKVSQKWMQDLSFIYNTPESGIPLDKNLSRATGSAFSFPIPTEQLVSNFKLSYDRDSQYFTSKISTPYCLSVNPDTPFFPSMTFQYKLPLFDQNIKIFNIGEKIGILSLTLHSTYTESLPDIIDPEYSPFYTISIPIYRQGTPFYAPPVLPIKQNEHEVSALLMAATRPYWMDGGTDFIAPYSNHFVQNFTISGPMRWSINIPWNTQFGGRNGLDKITGEKTELGKVRPKFLTLSPQGNFFFQHNSTQPFVEGFSCWINDITVPAIMTSRRFKFNPPVTTPVGATTTDTPSSSTSSSTSTPSTTPSQSLQSTQSNKTRSLQSNQSLQSNETILQLTLDDKFWDSAINQQILRFHTFSIHCGSIIALMAPNIRYIVEWELYPSSILIEISDEPLPSQSDGQSESLSSQFEGQSVGSAGQFTDIGQFLDQSEGQSRYRISAPFTPPPILPQPEYAFQWADKIPIEWMIHHLINHDNNRDNKDDEGDDIFLNNSNGDGIISLDNNNGHLYFNKYQKDGSNDSPVAVTSTGVTSTVFTSTTEATTSTNDAYNNSYYPIPSVPLPLLIPPSTIAPTTHPVPNRPELINLTTLVTTIIHIEHLAKATDCHWIPSLTASRSSTVSTGSASSTSLLDNEFLQCQFQLSIALSGGTSDSFQPSGTQEYVNIYFETLDKAQKWSIQTKWDNTLETKKFDLPYQYLINEIGQSHYYLKITFSLQLSGANPLKIHDLWEKNEIYLRFHPSPREFPLQSPIIFPIQMPIERWFLDARHSLGEITPLIDPRGSNIIVTMKYDRVLWDWKTLNTITSKSPQFLFFQQKKQLEWNKNVLNFENDQIFQNDNDDSIEILNDQVISYVTIHISGTFEFNLGQLDPAIHRHDLNHATTTSTDPITSPITLKCKGIQSCSATDIILSPRAISFKVNMDNDKITNNIAEESFFSTIFSSGNDIQTQISKKSKTSLSQISLQVLFSDQIHYSPIDYTLINPETELTPEPINLIAHVTLTNTTSGNNLMHNFGLTFQPNSNLNDIPSSFVVPIESTLPFWFFILIFLLVICIIILIIVVYFIITAPYSDPPSSPSSSSSSSSDIETSLVQAVENRMKGQISTFMSAVNKALDEYQPPTYSDLDLNGQSLEVLPEYDPELEGNNTIVGRTMNGIDGTMVDEGSGKNNLQDHKNQHTNHHNDDDNNGYGAPLSYGNLFVLNSAVPKPFNDPSNEDPLSETSSQNNDPSNYTPNIIFDQDNHSNDINNTTTTTTTQTTATPTIINLFNFDHENSLI